MEDDHVHPNEAGSKHMAKLVRDGLGLANSSTYKRPLTFGSASKSSWCDAIEMPAASPGMGRDSLQGPHEIHASRPEVSFSRVASPQQSNHLNLAILLLGTVLVSCACITYFKNRRVRHGCTGEFRPDDGKCTLMRSLDLSTRQPMLQHDAGWCGAPLTNTPN